VRQKFGLTSGAKTTESSAEGVRVAEAARAKRGGKE
jgi:hypothetical protein